MGIFNSDFMRLMHSRGAIHQVSAEGELDEVAKSGICGYVGFDCTADSLHVGNLLTIMMLRRLQQAGGKPIILLGGATSLIGDPSGRDESRNMLDTKKIEENKSSIIKVFERFVHFGDGAEDALLVDNADWLCDLNYIDFLREYGKHFSVNRMLGFDSVKLRLERDQPLSFLEFNYMIFQAYDFLELYRRHGCRLQMGGSDQWGNIINGIDLGRRVAKAELFGLTTPLITTSSGAKMGKTAEGAVWLNEDKLSPLEYWQFWRNTEDADIGRFLRLFTELPEKEIADLEKLEGSEINEAKKILATAAATLAHGEERAKEAERTAKETFEGSGKSDGLPSLEISENTGLLHALVTAGFSASNSEARKLIRSGGIRINDVSCKDEKFHFEKEHFSKGSLKLSAGKKRHILLMLKG
ncbi:MAG: tyrosine--tRNA ligase [Parvibaculales bacterium]